MAPLNHSYYQQNYSYPPPDSPESFASRWGTALYCASPAIESMDSSTWRGGYTPTLPVPHDPFYMPPSMHAVQQSPSMGHGNWALSGTLHPDFIPFHHSPPVVPETSNTILQPMIHDRLSTSTNSPDYVWVPQRQYGSNTHHFTPAHPIVFNVDSGEPGIRLSAALGRKFAQLKDRDDLVFASNKSPTITMRLEWPGYTPWGRQVRVLDSRSVQQPISREKLAYEVAKTVFKFVHDENGKTPSADGAPDRDRMWTLGEGNIGLDDLVLVHVENVSRGSWQPQFLVCQRHRD